MGSSSSNDLPTKSQIINNNPNSNNFTKTGNAVATPFSNNENNQNGNMPAPVPMGNQKEQVHPIDEFMDTPSEKVNKPSKGNNNNNPKILNRNQNIPSQNQNMPRQNQNIPQQYRANPNQQQPMPMVAGVASPYVQPVGVPLPYPGYPVPYYPGDPMYPYPYYPPQQPPTNTVVVLPPGYKPDYNPGYSPWGNLSEDLQNLF